MKTSTFRDDERMGFRQTAEYRRRLALIRQIREIHADILADRGGEPISSDALKEALADDDNQFETEAQLAKMDKGARPMTTTTTSDPEPVHDGSVQSDDFTQTAEYQRRMLVWRRLEELQAQVLARRDGEPIPVKMLEEILDEVKRGE